MAYEERVNRHNQEEELRRIVRVFALKEAEKNQVKFRAEPITDARPQTYLTSEWNNKMYRLVGWYKQRGAKVEEVVWDENIATRIKNVKMVLKLQ
jgi:hypothetical protein